MSKISMKRILVIFVLGAVLGGLVYFSPAFFNKPVDVAGTPKLQTGGSSVVYFVMDRWKKGFKDKDKELYVEYLSKGSKNGITNVIAKKYEIGFSHAPLTSEQLKEAKEKGGDVIQIPVGISAIVPIYNVKELKDQPPLNFTADLLAKIFLGDITMWDHDEIKAINKDIKFPKDAKITVVYREDASGSTQVFTEYLQEASEVWRKSDKGVRDQIQLKGKGVARSEHLANYVNSTEGAIGYVELMHARRLGLQYGAVENKDKKFILARPENITAAAEDAVREMSDDQTAKLTNRAGEKSYPICAAAWAICYQTQPASKQKMVKEFLTWITHEGQNEAVNVWTYSPTIKKAAATATVANGAVAAIKLNEEKLKDGTMMKLGGIGYQTPPKVTIEGGAGKGATATAAIARGKVTGITVTDPGTGYTSAPTVTIAPPAPELIFAPLPKEMVERVDKRLQSIRSVQ